MRWRTTRAIALNSLALLSTIVERRAAASSSAATLRHSTRSSLQTTRALQPAQLPSLPAPPA